jgi:hypothetical protein
MKKLFNLILLILFLFSLSSAQESRTSYRIRRVPVPLTICQPGDVFYAISTKVFGFCTDVNTVGSLPTGSGANGRITFWNGTNSLSSNSTFTFDGTNLSIPAGGQYRINGSAFNFTNLAGNIAVGQMNSGVGASNSTYWRGDGTWVALTSVIANTTIGNIPYLSASNTYSDSNLIQGTNIIEQRNGVNTQTFRVYKTFTDSSNYERLTVGNNGTDFTIIPENAGTGTLKKLVLGSAVSDTVFGNTNFFYVSASTGHLLVGQDNTHDIGASGANRPRTGYFGTSLVTPAITSSDYIFGNGSRIRDTSGNGIILFIDNSGTTFSRLQLGGTTSSFPALKRNVTAINFRLADDSADAPITASTAGFTGDTTVSSSQPNQNIVWTNTANYGAIVFKENATTKSSIQQIGSTFATTARRNFLELQGASGISLWTSGVQSFTVDTSGHIFAPNLSTSAGFQSGYICGGASGELVSDSGLCLASSGRFKYQIHPLNKIGLDELMKFNPVRYYYKPEFNGKLQSNINFNREFVGLIAEDVNKIDSRFVTYEKDNITPHSVRYEQLVALVIKAVQEEQFEINDLKSQVSELRQEVEFLKKRIR